MNGERFPIQSFIRWKIHCDCATSLKNRRFVIVKYGVCPRSNPMILRANNTKVISGRRCQGRKSSDTTLERSHSKVKIYTITRKYDITILIAATYPVIRPSCKMMIVRN